MKIVIKDTQVAEKLKEFVDLIGQAEFPDMDWTVENQAEVWEIAEEMFTGLCWATADGEFENLEDFEGSFISLYVDIVDRINQVMCCLLRIPVKKDRFLILQRAQFIGPFYELMIEVNETPALRLIE